MVKITYEQVSISNQLLVMLYIYYTTGTVFTVPVGNQGGQIPVNVNGQTILLTSNAQLAGILGGGTTSIEQQWAQFVAGSITFDDVLQQAINNVGALLEFLGVMPP